MLYYILLYYTTWSTRCYILCNATGCVIPYFPISPHYPHCLACPCYLIVLLCRPLYPFFLILGARTFFPLVILTLLAILKCDRFLVHFVCFVLGILPVFLVLPLLVVLVVSLCRCVFLFLLFLLSFLFSVHSLYS